MATDDASQFTGSATTRRTVATATTRSRASAVSLSVLCLIPGQVGGLEKIWYGDGGLNDSDILCCVSTLFKSSQEEREWPLRWRPQSSRLSNTRSVRDCFAEGNDGFVLGIRCVSLE